MSDSPGMSGTIARPPTLRKILSASSSSSVDADGVRPLEAGVAADQRAALHALQPRLDAVAVVAR